MDILILHSLKCLEDVQINPSQIFTKYIFFSTLAARPAPFICINVCLALNGLYVFVLISVEQMFLKRGLNENQEILKNIFQLFATAGTKVTVQDVRISKGYREKVVIVIFTLIDINTFFMVIIIAML